MPYGRTVIMWAVCDKCNECIEFDSEYGSKKEAAENARINGWTVRKDGSCLCYACKCKKGIGIDAEQ